MTERHATGIYNANGFAEHVTWGECFEKTQMVTGTDTTFTWVQEEFLRVQNLGGNELPIFAYSEDAGIFGFNNHKALAAGLHFRPIAETIRDTLQWEASEGEHKMGLTGDREQELLSAWGTQK